MRSIGRYGLAILAVGVALAARLALEPVLGPYQRYVTFHLCVIVVAALAGTGPALLATGLGAVAATHIAPPPTSDAFGRMAAGGAFVLIDVVLIAVVGALRRSRARELAHVRRLHVLAQASLAIRAAPTLQAICDALTAQARALLGAQQAVTTLHATVTGGEPRVTVDTVPGGIRIAPDVTARMARVVGRIGRPGRLRAADGVTSARSSPPCGWLAAPLVARDGRILGTIELSDHVDGDFSLSDESILVQLAQHAAVAIESVRGRLALEESEERIAGILRQATVGFAQCDAGGRLLVANDSFCRLAGRPRDVLLQLSVSEIVHPDDREQTCVLLGRTARSGEEFRIETRYRHPDGAYVWVSESVYRLQAPSGAAGRLCVVSVDITARKQAEAALVASERRLRRVVESNVIGMVFWDERGPITDANEAFAKMVGYEMADVRAGRLDWRRLVRPAHLATHGAALAEIRARGICAPIESELVRADGGVVPILCAGAALDDEPLRGVTWVLDVSARKRAEDEREALLQTAERARAAAFDAVQRVGRIQSITDTMLLDLPLDDLLQQLLSRVRTMLHTNTAVILLHEEGALRVRAAIGVDVEIQRQVRIPIGHGFAGAIARDRTPMVREDVGDDELAIPYADGSGTRSLAGVPLVTADGLVGVLKVGSVEARRFADDEVALLRLAADRIAAGIERATRRDGERRARTEAEAANRAKDEFLAMLSHELRNPLAAVRNAITVASLDRSQHRRALEIAARQCAQLARMVDDLLDLARITRGTITLRRERVRLADVVAQAIDAVRELVDDRGQMIATRLPPEAVFVDGDPVRLGQVVTNLLNNAVKYTGPGGHIDVEVVRANGSALVHVRDDGAGIAPDLLPRVFDLFTQGERPLDRALGGLGIGLTVARRIAEQHGGHVSAESAGVGCGARFTLQLPAPSAGAAPEDARSASGRVARTRLLVVEDNVDAADAFVMLLEQLGHEVSVAHDGPEALEAIRERPPAAALIDIGLPGMDGYELAQRIRARADLPIPYLVAVTGYGREEDRLRARTSGFDHHLVKPIELGDLQDVLAAVTARTCQDADARLGLESA